MYKSPIPALSPFIKLFDGASASGSVNTILCKENIILGLILCGQKANARPQRVSYSINSIEVSIDEAPTNEETVTRERVNVGKAYICYSPSLEQIVSNNFTVGL